ncbi:UDP-N-acetylglucosamine 2-epimerase (non-hydrolyzing) [bacterium]|nr:UDP-N-acetylglucosamine 2-epimerase (non-hydrolyzing) [bacterium]
MDGNQNRQVMVVMGTRPEAVKLAPVVLELKKQSDIKPVVVATAQHREMLDQVLVHFRIVPDMDLDLMTPDQSLFHLTGEAIHRFETVFRKARPDLILVQGDTTTSFIGALAGFYEKIRVGHVEAGLRTGNRYSPFPEEINRKLVSVLADYHFAPTPNNRQNLIAEGVDPDRIIVTGNTVIDALHLTVDDNFSPDMPLPHDYERLILITAHRRENFGKPLENICEAVRHMALHHPDWVFIYPVHLNMHVRAPVFRILSGVNNVQLPDPLDYYTFANTMARSDLILTDSGGIQEEAPGLGKPVLVLREETERPEAVGAGTVKVIGTDMKRIVQETESLLNSKDAYEQMARAHNPYGDGKAAERIVAFIRKAILL